MLILFISFLGRGLYKTYQVKQDVRSLEREIASVEGENQELLELIGYLKTPEYKERQARSVLNLQKPGEIAVALPGGETQSPARENSKVSGEENSESNWKKWWKYFFGR